MADSDQLELRFPDGRTAFLPGESIDVDVQWQLSDPAIEVELRLVWSTAGRGTRNLEVVGRRTVGAGSTGQSRQKLRLPETPYSFSGQLISLLWGLELVVDEGRISTRAEIVIAPERREVRLPSGERS